MKRILFFLTIIICFQDLGISQVEFKENRKYKVWIYSVNSTPVAKGYIHEIKDSTIVIVKSLETKNNSSNLTNLFEIDIQDISKIKIRRRGNIWHTSSIGAVTGLLLGSLIATNHKGEGGFGSDQVQIYAIYGGSMAILGFGLGALLGSSKIKILIDENNSFESIREKLEKIRIE